MKTISLVSQKGGAGKTTLAVALAVAAEHAGQRAAVLDLDPQATACGWSDRRGEDAPAVTDVQPARLGSALQRAAREGVDLVVLDTPPRSEQAALEAARAADLVLVPLRPQIYDLETVRNTQQLVQTVGERELAVVLNAVPSRGTRGEEAAAAVRELGVYVLNAWCGQRAAYGDAAALGQTPAEYEPNGKATREIRNVYMAVWQQLDRSA